MQTADSRTAGTLSATVIRANGRVERLGLISFRHPNPLIAGLVNTYITLKRKVTG